VVRADEENVDLNHSLLHLACSRRSVSGARVKNIASEKAGKNEGRLQYSSLARH